MLNVPQIRQSWSKPYIKNGSVQNLSYNSEFHANSNHQVTIIIFLLFFQRHLYMGTRKKVTKDRTINTDLACSVRRVLKSIYHHNSRRRCGRRGSSHCCCLAMRQPVGRPAHQLSSRDLHRLAVVMLRLTLPWGSHGVAAISLIVRHFSMNFESCQIERPTRRPRPGPRR